MGAAAAELSLDTASPTHFADEHMLASMRSQQRIPAVPIGDSVLDWKEALIVQCMSCTMAEGSLRSSLPGKLLLQQAIVVYGY